MLMLLFFLMVSSQVMTANAGIAKDPMNTINVDDVIYIANLVKTKLNIAKLPVWEKQIDELIIDLHAISPEDRAMMNDPNRADDREPVVYVLYLDSMLECILTNPIEDAGTCYGNLNFYKNTLEYYLAHQIKKTATSDEKKMRKYSRVLRLRLSKQDPR